MPDGYRVKCPRGKEKGAQELWAEEIKQNIAREDQSATKESFLNRTHWYSINPPIMC